MLSCRHKSFVLLPHRITHANNCIIELELRTTVLRIYFGYHIRHGAWQKWLRLQVTRASGEEQSDQAGRSLVKRHQDILQSPVFLLFSFQKKKCTVKKLPKFCNQSVLTRSAKKETCALYKLDIIDIHSWGQVEFLFLFHLKSKNTSC